MRWYDRLILEDEFQTAFVRLQAEQDSWERISRRKRVDELTIRDYRMRIRDDFVGMAKDVRDSFKPYKSFVYVLREFYHQPFAGLRNVIHGLYFVNTVLLAGLIYSLGFLTPPSLFIYAAVVFMMPSFRATSIPFFYSGVRRSFMDAVKIEALLLLGSAASLIRGVTQLVTWPLTLLRIPVRGLITLIKGAPKIEDNRGIQKLLEKCNEPLSESHRRIMSTAFLLKYQKARKRHQKSVIPQETIDTLFSDGSGHAFSRDHNPRAIIAFFKAAVKYRQTGDPDDVPCLPARSRDSGGRRRRSRSVS